MGYEVIFHYYNEITRGEYDKENPQKKVVKFGDFYEEVSLDELAKKIIIQLARRNILIYDVEIFEFAKKQISFKETKDGILIKHKKFIFDENIQLNDSCNIKEEVIMEEQPEVVNQNPNIPEQNKKTFENFKIPTQNKKILRYETFNPPDKNLLEDCKRRGMKFTVGKKYPVFKERNSGNIIAGNLFYTEDDDGKMQILSERLFNEVVNKLKYGDLISEENNSLDNKSPNKLSWDGELDGVGDIVLRK